jgi:Fic family protein
VTIHPFIDGNGRTARLLMNLALLQDGYPIAVIPPVLRTEYLDALRKSQKTPRDDRPFFDFIASVCYESAKDTSDCWRDEEESSREEVEEHKGSSG